MSESREDIVVLIPSHGLEDFPTELGEGPASSLLNAFAAAWHPALVAAKKSIPTWERADEPPSDIGTRVVFVPEPAEEWLPGGWATRAESEGATVVRSVEERADVVAKALSGLQDVPEVDAELVADFHALGSCWLQIELLTRHMHHFSNLDDAQLQREGIAAAESAVAGDAEATRAHLRRCFEALHEARERFYPVDCYLLDLCLLIPELADDHLVRTAGTDQPKNLLVCGTDLDEIARESAEALEAVRAAHERGTLDVVGGEYRERPTTLLPLGSLLHEFESGRAVFRERFGKPPRTWGRRRFGLSTLLPQILTRSGYHTALHVILDDGFYPDAEGSKERWEGCDGSVVDAVSRIPLAGDSAVSFLRFSQRMAEAMDMDQVAAVVFARWPEVKTPWLDDLVRMSKYAPVLGEFVTFETFSERTEMPGRLSTYRESEYLSPFLVQAVARKESSPLGRYASHLTRRTYHEAGSWLRNTAAALLGRPPQTDLQTEWSEAVESGGPDPNDAAPADLDASVYGWMQSSAGQLAELVLTPGDAPPGRLVFNPLSFQRRVACDLPAVEAVDLAGPVKVAQKDGDSLAALVEVPACGFAWFPVGESTSGPDGEHESLVDEEELVMRNEFFEVHVSPTTGGIHTIKEFGRKPNRLSQQLAMRFAHEKTIPAPEGGGEPTRTFYSSMECTGTDVTSTGPAFAEVVTRGNLLDPSDGSVLARFSQRFRLWRGRRTLDVAVVLDVKRMPEGSPWNEYVASRFAWNETTAAVGRSVLGQAHLSSGERIESLHFVEIANTGDERTTIVPFGLPFHRKSGDRMIDSLMVVEGEEQRHFRFAITVDDPYPMQAALDALVPPVVLPTNGGRPNSGATGWFFHLSAKNVQLTAVLPLLDPDPVAVRPDDEGTRDEVPAGNGFAVRLVETEGRRREVKLRLFRTPSYARQRDFEGRTIGTLPIQDDAVIVNVTPYEIADVELRFD